MRAFSRPSPARFPFRILTLTLGVGLASLPALRAERLNPAYVDAEAGWLIHLDLDSFRETTLGTRLDGLSKEAEVNNVSPGLRLKLNEAARLLGDLTAYGGPNLGNRKQGVLILRGAPGMTQILEAALINEEASGEHVEVEIVQDKPYPLYLVRRDSYVAIHSPTLVIASKSRLLLEQAREVILGQRPAAAADSLPGGALPEREGFFFIGAAENMADNPALPAKAAILRMARQARLVAGEHADDVFLLIELLADNDTVADRMQKVIQGMLALVSLTAYENVDFQDFVSRVRVETQGPLVTVNFQLPARELIDIIDDLRERRQNKADTPSDDAI